MPTLPSSSPLRSYTPDFVRRAMALTAEEYARRLRSNAATRKTAAADGLARHLNPESLEAARSLSRSADSILGNMLEVLARDLARGKWGPQACPAVIAGAGVSAAEAAAVGGQKDKQIIVSRVDFEALRKQAAACYRKPNVDLRRLAQVAANPPMSRVIHKQPLDLVVLLGGRIVAAELKASGDLDVKNGPKNVETLLAISCILGPKALPVFVLANKRIADSAATRFVSSDLLVGRDEFWTWLLPPGYDWRWFDTTFGSAAAPVRAELTRWLSAA